MRRRPLTLQAKALNPGPSTQEGKGRWMRTKRKMGQEEQKNGHRDETTGTDGYALASTVDGNFFLSFSSRPSVHGLTFLFFLSTPPCLLYILDSTVQYLASSPQFPCRVETHCSDKSGAISTSTSISICTPGAKTSLSSKPCCSRCKSTLS